MSFHSRQSLSVSFFHVSYDWPLKPNFGLLLAAKDRFTVMLKLMNKKTFTILQSERLFISTYVRALSESLEKLFAYRRKSQSKHQW